MKVIQRDLAKLDISLIQEPLFLGLRYSALRASQIESSIM